ncbi:hypothetical protein C5167_009979 [Papaver somniferum]|uniref:Uncharacterized protein n=1 Tax=Papaver somniferum TaxID=3469 RepID=A0A4Y7K1T2_PAPSO|nr:hypothetical protein C5167_009979 [Papaver somniferum]
MFLSLRFIFRKRHYIIMDLANSLGQEAIFSDSLVILSLGSPNLKP